MLPNLEIKRLLPDNNGRFEELIRLFEVVFHMKNFTMPGPGHLSRLLARKDFHVFVALHENSIIGGLTAYTLEQYYSTKPLAYIFDLAVAEAWQRKGVGQTLIAQTNLYFREQGYQEVFVQADKVDQYALDFYRKTNPDEEEDVSHFYYSLNP